MRVWYLGQIKEYPVFWVSRPYLNLLVKPRNIFMYSGKNIILCILKDKMPFKMPKIIFVQKKKLKKYLCLPYLKFPDHLHETLIFLFGLTK